MRQVAEQKIVALERRKVPAGKTDAGRVLILIYTNGPASSHGRS